jgi:hypothetical protein
MKHAASSLAPLLALWLVCGSLSPVFVGPAFSADQPERPAAATSPNVTGKWTYTLDVSLDTSLDFTAELKQDGETVTGSITVQEVKTAIEKGKFKDGQLTFEIPREYGGVKFTSRYSGKLTGDKLTGKILSGTAPLERTYEWSAKREKTAAKP